MDVSLFFQPIIFIMSSSKNEPKKKFSSGLNNLKFMKKSSNDGVNDNFDSKNPEKWINPVYLEMKKENTVIIETKDPFLLKLNSESNGRRTYGQKETKKETVTIEEKSNVNSKKRFYVESEKKQKKKKKEDQ